MEFGFNWDTLCCTLCLPHEQPTPLLLQASAHCNKSHDLVDLLEKLSVSIVSTLSSAQRYSTCHLDSMSKGDVKRPRQQQYQQHSTPDKQLVLLRFAHTRPDGDSQEAVVISGVVHGAADVL